MKTIIVFLMILDILPLSFLLREVKILQNNIGIISSFNKFIYISPKKPRDNITFGANIPLIIPITNAIKVYIVIFLPIVF